MVFTSSKIALAYQNFYIFLRMSPCFLQTDCLERFVILLGNSLSKVNYVKMDNNWFSKVFSRQPKVAWAFFSARLLALLAFLASAVGAKNALSEIFSLEHVDGTYDNALKLYFELGKIEMAPENEIQKKTGQSQSMTVKLQTWFYDSNQRT